MRRPGLPIVELHREIEDEANALARAHAARLQCKKGCHDCCVDELSVFEVEANRIRSKFGALLSSGRPHPPGACAFLDAEGACRIYEARPYVCRTQGLPLRWLDEDGDELVEYRDICPLNEAGEPVEALAPSSCWSLGPFEERLAAMQGDGRRVRLRDLFSGS